MSEILAGKAVLIVEDEILVAMELESALGAVGALPTIAVTVAEAVAALKQAVDIAVLDINLGKETTLPIAHALHERGVPFVFVSGYRTPPPSFAGLSILQKPISSRDVLDVLARVLTAPGES